MQPFPDLVGFTANEARWVSQTVVTSLNRAIDDAVAWANNALHARARWQVVKGINVQFSTHGLCADRSYNAGHPANRFFNTVFDSVLIQDPSYFGACDLDDALDDFLKGGRACDYVGAFHPNAAGYRTYERPIVEALKPLFLPPATPSGLKIRNMTPTSVEIGWNDNSSNEDVFRIRVMGIIPTPPDIEEPWGTTRKTIASLVPGQTYTFAVQACSYVLAYSGSCSAWIAVTATLQPPAAPSSLQVTADPWWPGFAKYGNLYYTSVPMNTCPLPGSWFDGANCYVATVPDRTQGFVYNNKLYVTPICRPW